MPEIITVIRVLRYTGTPERINDVLTKSIVRPMLTTTNLVIEEVYCDTHHEPTSGETFS